MGLRVCMESSGFIDRDTGYGSIPMAASGFLFCAKDEFYEPSPRMDVDA